MDAWVVRLVWIIRPQRHSCRLVAVRYTVQEDSKIHGDEFRASLVFSAMFLGYFPLLTIMGYWGNSTI